MEKTQLEAGYEEETEEHWDDLNKILAQTYEDGRQGKSESTYDTDDVMELIAKAHLKKDPNYYSKSKYKKTTRRGRVFLHFDAPLGRIGRILK